MAEANSVRISGLEEDTLKMEAYPPGFEEDDRLRSAFIRELTLQQVDGPEAPGGCGATQTPGS